MTQMDPSFIDAMAKSKEKLSLHEPITPAELYSLMDRDRNRFPGDFKLKKGLFGESIVFDKYMDFGAKIKVRKDTVIITRIEPSNNSNSRKRRSIGQLAEVVKTAQTVIDAVKTGEISEDLMGGPKYFQDICKAVREMLQSRMNSSI